MQADILASLSNQRMRRFQFYPCCGLAQIFIHYYTVDSMSRCLRNLRSLISATDPLEVLEVTVRNAGNVAARENARFKITISTSWREFGARSHKIRESLVDNHVRADCYSNLSRGLGVCNQLVRDCKINPV